MIEKEIKKLVAEAVNACECPECDGTGTALVGPDGRKELGRCGSCDGSGKSRLERVLDRLKALDAERTNEELSRKKTACILPDPLRVIYREQEYPLSKSNSEFSKVRNVTVSLYIERRGFLSFNFLEEGWAEKAERVLTAYLEEL